MKAGLERFSGVPTRPPRRPPAQGLARWPASGSGHDRVGGQVAQGGLHEPVVPRVGRQGYVVAETKVDRPEGETRGRARDAGAPPPGHGVLLSTGEDDVGGQPRPLPHGLAGQDLPRGVRGVAIDLEAVYADVAQTGVQSCIQLRHVTHPDLRGVGPQPGAHLHGRLVSSLNRQAVLRLRHALAPADTETPGVHGRLPAPGLLLHLEVRAEERPGDTEGDRRGLRAAQRLQEPRLQPYGRALGRRVLPGLHVEVGHLTGLPRRGRPRPAGARVGEWIPVQRGSRPSFECLHHELLEPDGLVEVDAMEGVHGRLAVPRFRQAGPGEEEDR